MNRSTSLRLALVLTPLALLLTACGDDSGPTSWQDVAVIAVFLFGWAAITWASYRG